VEAIGFLSCDCFLFSSPQRSSVSNNKPLLKMAPGCGTLNYGDQQNGFSPQCWPAIQEESLLQ
jgi:hypothetical protein